MSAVKKVAGYIYEVEDRCFGKSDTLKVLAGGLGDNIIIRTDDFSFSLALASIDAIVKDAGLRAGPEVEIEKPAPEWHEALVIRADYGGESRVFAKDLDGDWVTVGEGGDGGYVFRATQDQDLSNVEILVRA